MFSETRRGSTCPYQLTIFGLLIIGLLLTIDRVTAGVNEQECDCLDRLCNFVTILNDLKYFNSGTLPKKG